MSLKSLELKYTSSQHTGLQSTDGVKGVVITREVRSSRFCGYGTLQSDSGYWSFVTPYNLLSVDFRSHSGVNPFFSTSFLRIRRPPVPLSGGVGVGPFHPLLTSTTIEVRKSPDSD